MSVALFPGQGAYRPGALAGLWEQGDDIVRDTFEEVDAVAKERLGHDVSSTVFRPAPPSPAVLLESAPDTLQMAVFATAVATYRLLEDRSGGASVLLGHSLGELAALTCAGAYGLPDAAAVLCERISVLREHDLSGGSMLALGCGRERAERLVALIDRPRLVLAVDNGADQTVVSGPDDAVATVAAIARQLDVSATPLRSPHPFHNPLLADARRRFATRIAGFAHRTPTRPVYSPILGRFYGGGDDLAELLALHLVTPVEFGASVSALYAAGARVFVEAGAKRALTTLVAEAHPGARVLAPLAGRDDEAGLALAAEALRGPVGGDLVAAAPAARAAHPAPSAPAEGVTGAAAASPVVAAAPARSAPAALDRDELAQRVRVLYAEAMEYPEEIFTDEVLLEADLGVDSVKQTELLSRLGDRFGLGVPPAGLRVGDYDTFGKVVDFVAAGVEGGGFTTTATGR